MKFFNNGIPTDHCAEERSVSINAKSKRNGNQVLAAGVLFVWVQSSFFRIGLRNKLEQSFNGSIDILYEAIPRLLASEAAANEVNARGVNFSSTLTPKQFFQFVTCCV
jgi:hypothetical protein